jgi:hypothetical protein
MATASTCYNRAYNDYSINDLYTPDKIIDRFMMIRSWPWSSNGKLVDLATPPYTNWLEAMEALLESLWERNVSDEQWFKLRNQ